MFLFLTSILFLALYFTSPPKRYPVRTQEFSFDDYKRRVRENSLTKTTKSSTIYESSKVLPFKPRENKSKKN